MKMRTKLKYIKKFEALDSSFYMTKDVIDDVFLELYDLGYTLEKFTPREYEEIECPKCKDDPGFLQCPNCKGDGIYHCDDCHDDSSRSCNSCEEGMVECEDCRKELKDRIKKEKVKKKWKNATEDEIIEYVIDNYDWCGDCDEGWYVCGDCDGEQVIKCKSCHGDGGNDCSTCGSDGLIYCDECEGEGVVANAVKTYLLKFKGSKDLPSESLNKYDRRELFRTLAKFRMETEIAVSSIEERINKLGYDITDFGFEDSEVDNKINIELEFVIEKK